MKDWTPERIAWVDVESTGNRPETDLLLEVAVVVTSAGLRELGRESLVIDHAWEDVDAIEMVDVVREMHEKNGLFEEIREREYLVSMEEADHRMTTLLNSCCEGLEDQRIPLGGCSTWIDRSLVRLHLPKFYSRLHHRGLDASSLKLAMVNWAGDRFHRKKYPHRALGDTLSAISLTRSIKRRLFELKRLRVEVEELKRELRSRQEEARLLGACP